MLGLMLGRFGLVVDLDGEACFVVGVDLLRERYLRCSYARGLVEGYYAQEWRDHGGQRMVGDQMEA